MQFTLDASKPIHFDLFLCQKIHHDVSSKNGEEYYVEYRDPSKLSDGHRALVQVVVALKETANHDEVFPELKLPPIVLDHQYCIHSRVNNNQLNVDPSEK